MRLPEESELAYPGFRAYLDSGPARSIAAAYRSVKGLPEDEAVKAPGHFGGWATRYEWRQRAAEWDAHVESLTAIAKTAELQAAGKQTVEQAADLQAIIKGKMERLREEIAKERRISVPPVDHSAELANTAGARLMALDGVVPEQD